MAMQDSSLKSLRDDELVVLTMDAISAGPLTGEHGELIEPTTEQARVASGHPRRCDPGVVAPRRRTSDRHSPSGRTGASCRLETDGQLIRVGAG